MKIYYDEITREAKLEMDSARQDIDEARREIEELRKEIGMDSKSFKSYSDSIEKILGSSLSKKTTKVSIPMPGSSDDKKKVTKGIMNEAYKDIRDRIAEVEAKFKKDNSGIMFSISKNIINLLFVIMFISMTLMILDSVSTTPTVSTQSEGLPTISSTTTPSKGLPAPD